MVDNCLTASDTNKQYANKQYTINPQTSYSPSQPIQQGLTSLAPINFEMIVSQSNGSEFGKNVKTHTLLCFCLIFVNSIF